LEEWVAKGGKLEKSPDKKETKRVFERMFWKEGFLAEKWIHKGVGGPQIEVKVDMNYIIKGLICRSVD